MKGKQQINSPGVHGWVHVMSHKQNGRSVNNSIMVYTYMKFSKIKIKS